jgi:hypothetical protein
VRVAPDSFRLMRTPGEADLAWPRRLLRRMTGKPFMPYAVFHVRSRSLLRGTLLVLVSLILAMRWAGFPNIHPSLLVAIPAAGAFYGTWETTRCLRRRWSFYHGGVMLLLYADILVLGLIVFLLLYPYAHWLQAQ